LPKNTEATLFSYTIINGKITFTKKDINTSDEFVKAGKYLPFENSDALEAKMNELVEPKVN